MGCEVVDNNLSVVAAFDHLKPAPADMALLRSVGRHWAREPVLKGASAAVDGASPLAPDEERLIA